ncbi:unnamed protein product [Nippostrongylus brasiliensis]|uniref:Transmembrane protein n=1 Tax=Nippostrongylus brasiliensis TaxID=27835 RepID=A0A158QXU9_NIPBR|nr:unnamed protein product [Nippostrongylus brasiliensis]
MWSSTILLSLSSVFGIIGLALVLAAALTDNWTEYQLSKSKWIGKHEEKIDSVPATSEMFDRFVTGPQQLLRVNRREVINAFNREPELNVRLKDAFVRNVNYFSRNYGLFQICFPDSVPSDVGSFSKYGSPCIDNSDYFPVEAVQENYSSQQTQRLYFMRANVSVLLSSVLQSLESDVPDNRVRHSCSLESVFFSQVYFENFGYIVDVPALILLFAVSMACWHYVNYLERAVLEMAPFYKSWEPILKSTTRFNFGWSLVVAWVGILFILFAAVFFICSASRLKVKKACSHTIIHLLLVHFIVAV